MCTETFLRVKKFRGDTDVVEVDGVLQMREGRHAPDPEGLLRGLECSLPPLTSVGRETVRSELVQRSPSGRHTCVTGTSLVHHGLVRLSVRAETP